MTMTPKLPPNASNGHGDVLLKRPDFGDKFLCTTKVEIWGMAFESPNLQVSS
jgi:hypothetical protein